MVEPPLPPEVQRVQEVVAARLAASGGRADVEVLWSDRAGMWFVEVRPTREGAAPVSVGVEGDTVYLSVAGHNREAWGRSGKTPDDWLGERLAEVFAGRVKL